MASSVIARLLSAGLALSALALPAQAQIKLGVGGPMTGPSAAFGAQLKNGVEQAAEDINAAGGILGQKIQTFTGDDASKPEQGVSAANKFVGDGVKFVVGHFNSGVSIPASDVYSENGLLQITPASTNPKLTERGLWNVFRTCGRDDQQGAIAANYIVDKLKDKRIVVLHDKTPYGKGLADEMKKAMNAKGVREVLYEGVNPGERDYSAVVTKLKQQRADVLFWGGLYPEAGVLLRQMREQGLNTVLIGGDGIATAELAAIAGDAAVEGTLLTFGPDPSKRPDAAELLKKFAAKNINPETYTLYSYAAVQVIKKAAEKANSLEPKKVADAMHSGMSFDTVLGKLSFDKKGDRTDADYVMYVWKKMPDGKMSFVEM